MGEVWFAPDDPSLPTPWKGVVDGNTGCLYYWNLETNITQYEKPAYWVSSPSLSPACSPGLFYPHHLTASDYNLHSQDPNLYPHYQAPAETVINGYTFPTQFPFPNHTHTPTNQPINPQSQSTDYHYHSLTHPPIAHPSYHLPPFAISAYPSESNGYLSSLPYPSDKPFSCDPYSTSPHNSSYSPITYPHTEPNESIVHPYQLPYAADLIPPSALAYTAGGTSCTEKVEVPPPEMKKSLRHNLKMRSHVTMKRKSRSQFPRRRRTQNNGGSEGDLCKAPLLMAVNWDSTVLSNKSLDSVSELTILDLVVKNGFISTSSKDAPMFFPGDDVDAVYNQLLGSDELYQTERAKDILLLGGFRQILDKKGGPIVDWELRSFDTKVSRLYLNCSLGKSLMNSDNIPEETVQSASVNHFCNLVVVVDHFPLVTNMLSGLNPILLSMGFVESPVVLEVSLPESYQHKIKHGAVAFDTFLVCSFTSVELMETVRVAHLRTTLPNWKGREKNALASSTGGFEYDVHPENLIESLTRNSQKFFIKMHGRRIERQCSALYHWLSPSLNWDQKSMSAAFLCHEFSVSCVTVKFLLSEFYKSGSKFLQKAMVEASLENIGLKVGIGAHWKVMDHAMHLVGVLAIETVVRTISTALVDGQNFGGALIILELQLGLSTVVVLPFVAVMRNNSDGQLNLLVQSNFYVEVRHRSCILHTAHEQSHFLVQLQKISGIISFAILEHLKNTCRVIYFVILVEGYLMNFLLSSEDPVSEHWSNKSSKFGACMDKMMISPKWDAISWKLVVITIVKVVLKEDANFYYYDKWAISLVILHFGCRSFFFLYECVGHFRTDAENSTIINGGVKYGNMFSCTMTTDTLGHLKLHGLLAIDDDGAAHNALEYLSGLLRHDTKLYLRYFLGILEIYVAWKKTKFLTVFYINLSNPILDEDLEYIMKTWVSTNATALRSTSWNAILIFYGSHCQAFSMLLIEMTPKPFYTATVAAKVRPGEPTLLKVPSAIFSVAKIALGHHNPSLEQADVLLIFNSMVLPLRCCSGAHLTMANSTVVLELVLNLPAHAPYYNYPGMINLSEATFTHNWGYWLNWEVMPHATWDFILMIATYFIVRRRVIFGGIHTANSLGILQTGQEEYNVQSYMKKVDAHQLLILNPSDVVVKMGILTLSTYFKLIFALVMAKTIVDTDDMIAEVSGTITVHDTIPFLMSTTFSCGYWHAKKAKAKSFHAIMWGAGIQSTENLTHEDQKFKHCCSHKGYLAAIGSHSVQFPTCSILRHEDMPSFKGGGMIGS